ncbi:uncharacterized protein STEHIDRAFT_117410 [Stereum hirsutum FP-91666 SS1]|uniref:uncharacterized protein n=1 Tax=Stereum hirsutum (strain FP-91666) TaxID=721885 RepID=UPI000440B367|nr:uncharacterized protein STEHIDRAFT_117410 [Stereum hirsutum FP-91666 SS1]EIM92390.1 hypothetical protein STEHIDRAFT_117410 [Stereum hirsutum FP-91666 SS1]
MDDDDEFLYGESATPEPARSSVVTPVTLISTSVPQPIPLDKTSISNGPVAQLEAKVAEQNELVQLDDTDIFPDIPPADTRPSEPPSQQSQPTQPEGQAEDEQGDEDAEGEEDEEEAEGEESEDDIEFIMEPQSRSLDLRPNRPAAGNRTLSATAAPSKAPQQPGPSLTTEYTPRDRGGNLTKSTSQAQLATPTSSQTTNALNTSTSKPQAGSTDPAQSQTPVDEGPDPSTLPSVTAPASHPSVNPGATGVLDGRSILDFDVANMTDKAWRRPGSDISDWFNYGFDEISWEAYCYRRRDVGEVANVLKANVLNFAGLPEDQLSQLPPEMRTMVMAGSTAMMNNGGGGQMMGPGMNVNGMMGPGDMNMQGMMNPIMGGMGMGGDMGMDGPGQGGNGGGDQGMGQGMGVGDGFGPQGGPGGMMGGMGMGGEFGMQDPNAMQQGMFPGMDGPQGPTPVPVGINRGGQGTPNPNVYNRGRGMGPGMGIRGRGSYTGRGRGMPAPPVRPASPLPPNVPTGPRNQNKYKDRDNNGPAVDGLDYGGGAGGQDRSGSTPIGDYEERSSSRKRRDRSPTDERRDSKRR